MACFPQIHAHRWKWRINYSIFARVVLCQTIFIYTPLTVQTPKWLAHPIWYFSHDDFYKEWLSGLDVLNLSNFRRKAIMILQNIEYVDKLFSSHCPKILPTIIALSLLSNLGISGRSCVGTNICWKVFCLVLIVIADAGPMPSNNILPQSRL